MKISVANSIASATLVLGAFGCAGEGGDFSGIEKTVVGTCGSCHDPVAFDGLLADIESLPPSEFTAERFPDAHFPADLRSKTTADLIAAANPPKDADIDPTTPDRQAWVLNQMHELELQLEATPTSDFTNQEAFDSYNAFGGDFPQGCETVDRLDRADDGLPTQMPPLYTEPLFDALGIEYVPLTPDDREKMREFVLGTLPTGPSACFF